MAKKQPKRPIKKGKKQPKKTGAMQVRGKRPMNAEKGEFKPGQSGNPKGRPPKLLSHILEELKSQGFERVSPAQIAEGYELLFNLSETKIKGYIQDEKSPMFLRIIAKAMLSGKGPEMLERMLDRAHGKAKQIMDHTTNGKDLNLPVISWATQKKE